MNPILFLILVGLYATFLYFFIGVIAAALLSKISPKKDFANSKPFNVAIIILSLVIAFWMAENPSEPDGCDINVRNYQC